MVVAPVVGGVVAGEPAGAAVDDSGRGICEAAGEGQ